MATQKPLDQVRSSAVALLRFWLRQLFNSIGIILSDSSAQLFSYLIIFFLATMILGFLSLSLALFLGEYLDSLGLGFLSVAGIYVTLLILFVYLRPRLEAQVRNKVARGAHTMGDKLEEGLNHIEALRISSPYTDVYLSAEPFPYQSLSLRRDEAKRQALQASQGLRQGVQYLRSNYVQVFGSMLRRTIPSARYLSPFLRFIHKAKGKPSSYTDATIDQGTSLGKTWLRLAPYMPYITTVYKFLSPFISAFVLRKAQGWFIDKMFRSKKRR